MSDEQVRALEAEVMRLRRVVVRMQELLDHEQGKARARKDAEPPSVIRPAAARAILKTLETWCPDPVHQMGGIDMYFGDAGHGDALMALRVVAEPATPEPPAGVKPVACSRCGAPLAPGGMCSRRAEGCQGGWGESQPNEDPEPDTRTPEERAEDKARVKAWLDGLEDPWRPIYEHVKARDPKVKPVDIDAMRAKLPVMRERRDEIQRRLRQYDGHLPQPPARLLAEETAVLTEINRLEAALRKAEAPKPVEPAVMSFEAWMDRRYPGHEKWTRYSEGDRAEYAAAVDLARSVVLEALAAASR